MNALRAVRREELNNITLTSEYNERTAAERNRLGADFKQYLLKTFTDNWLFGAIILFSFYSGTTGRRR